MNIKKARNLRHIRRFNFHNCNKYESVAEHSFFVTVLARTIAILCNYSQNAISLVVDVALYHDIEEAVTGDIPYLVRKQIPNMKEIESMARVELEMNKPGKLGEAKEMDEVKAIVEFADAMELKLYLEEERNSGNMALYDIERETWKRLQDIDLPNPSVKNEILMNLERVRPKDDPDYLSH